MARAMIEAVASSSAHGISRAASAKGTPLKVMWILLFLVFLAFFLKDGIHLVMKLKQNKLTRIYNMDQVPFVFPDLYFCPNNPYSGSYPYSLSRSEAELLNAEVSRILTRYEGLYGSGLPSNFSDAGTRVLFAQASLPFHLMVRHLLQRKEQAVLAAALRSSFRRKPVQLEAFYHPEYLVCFKALLTEEFQLEMQSVDNALEIWLTTDPYFSDLNFTGYPIDPIVDRTNLSVPFLSWHPVHIVEELKKSGYAMLTVPQGAYPSQRFENTFHLAPGNAYSVKLDMIENTCSEELHTTHCADDEPEVAFTNPLTEQPELFKYSKTACYYRRRNSRLVERLGCQNSLYPALWEYHSWPRCLNVSEVTKAVVANIVTLAAVEINKFEVDATEHCKKRTPCTHQHYRASFSFGKWPSMGSSTAHYFASIGKMNLKLAPGLAKLASIAERMQTGNHSAHLEGIFRSYVSESMLSVSISAASTMSTQVVLTWSYTVTDFMADTGGLLGLYIGCSLLTLCELLELLYVLLNQVCHRRLQPAVTSGGVEAVSDVIAKSECLAGKVI